MQARRQHPAFGRGTIEFLRCDNPKVLAFRRAYAADTIVVVANLARSRQAAVIECPPAMSGFYFVDVVDGEVLPPIAVAPYTVMLSPQACRWLQPVWAPAVAERPILSRIMAEPDGAAT
jgi:maltose alpha-D-glucosyltransferase/alpha-amylase